MCFLAICVYSALSTCCLYAFRFPIVIVLFILGFALTSDKGKNTVHARKSGAATDLSNISKETRPNSVQVN